ncbi:unnamed protein product [Schistosoma rodhaini]|uniref:Uncharacterized protein n=1 Tax=Schistosoma rodhaini TaxID=6188 RepID=A0AA85G9R3_9TREM|nr:unnamed protein product [Schistosoma rodhaini]CAH8623436.1 unnamed protein product [Schistosoma rodhaini]
MNESVGFYIPLGVVSAFWFLVGFLGPVFVPKGPNKMLLSVSIVLTAVCCYLLILPCTVPSFFRTFIENRINKNYPTAVDAQKHLRRTLSQK